jgi:hypothetical protein
MGTTRRKFTLEFKTEAAHRVIDTGRTGRGPEPYRLSASLGTKPTSGITRVHYFWRTSEIPVVSGVAEHAGRDDVVRIVPARMALRE